MSENQIDYISVNFSTAKNNKNEIIVNGKFSQADIINTTNKFNLKQSKFRNHLNILNFILDFSHYDIVAGPREILDPSKIKIDNKKITRILDEILKCTICLNVFNEPVNFRKCIHKFCETCIKSSVMK
jgi:hypothetical protein